MSHKDPNGWYINWRESASATYSKKYIEAEKVFFVKRHYRYKENTFTHMIAEVQRANEDEPLDYYYVLCRWNKNENNPDVCLNKHGNAKKPFASMKYYL